MVELTPVLREFSVLPDTTFLSTSSQNGRRADLERRKGSRNFFSTFERLLCGWRHECWVYPLEPWVSVECRSGWMSVVLLCRMSKTKCDSCSWVPMMRALQGTWLATRVYALTPFSVCAFLLRACLQ